VPVVVVPVVVVPVVVVPVVVVPVVVVPVVVVPVVVVDVVVPSAPQKVRWLMPCWFGPCVRPVSLVTGGMYVYNAWLSLPALTKTPLTASSELQLNVWPLPETFESVIAWPVQLVSTDWVADV